MQGGMTWVEWKWNGNNGKARVWKWREYEEGQQTMNIFESAIWKFQTAEAC